MLLFLLVIRFPVDYKESFKSKNCKGGKNFNFDDFEKIAFFIMNDIKIDVCHYVFM